MNLLLINNHSVLNIGDQAILRQTLDLLDHTFPTAQVELSFNDVASARALLPERRVIPALLLDLLGPGGQGGPRHPLRWAIFGLWLLLACLWYRLAGRLPPLPRRQRELLAPYARADLVLACGGGYIYAVDNRDLRGFALRLLSCGVAVLMGKPLVLLPQSIGPLHSQPQRWMVRQVVRRARLTWVREPRSLELLRRLDCDQRAMLAPDLAFGYPAHGAAVGPAVAALVGAQPRPGPLVGLTALDWGRQNHAFAAQSSYLEELGRVIDAITGEGGIVVLFAQCLGPSPLEDDRLVAARLQAQARCPDRVKLAPPLLDPGELQAWYGHMDYFIATRMHSLILALNAGVPGMAVGYLHKTRGMLEQLDLAGRCCDIADLAPGGIGQAFEQLRARPAQPRLAAYQAWALRSQRAIGALLRQLVAA